IAAAGGLLDMVHLIWHRRARGFGIGASPDQVVESASLVVGAAGLGLKHKPGQARRLCTEAIHEAAVARGGLVPRETGGPPLEEDVLRKMVEKEQALFKQLTDALKKQLPELVKALDDEDAAVCLAVNQALETLATVRLKVLARATALAHLFK